MCGGSGLYCDVFVTTHDTGLNEQKIPILCFFLCVSARERVKEDVNVLRINKSSGKMTFILRCKWDLWSQMDFLKHFIWQRYLRERDTDDLSYVATKAFPLQSPEITLLESKHVSSCYN